MRYALEDLGATIIFGKKLTNLIMDPNNPSVVQGIQVEQSEQSQWAEGDEKEKNAAPEILTADAIVLATGHSARDVYETLARGSGGVCLEPKGFAVGFRIEHPQKVVTKIQYGNEWGATVRTGKRQTDRANEEYFAGEERKQEHAGSLPVPSYRLATDKARDGTSNERLRGVYSFCMCPGAFRQSSSLVSVLDIFSPSYSFLCAFNDQLFSYSRGADCIVVHRSLRNLCERDEFLETRFPMGQLGIGRDGFSGRSHFRAV